MDKNITSENLDSKDATHTPNVLLLVSLTVGFTFLGIMIFVVTMIYLKKNKGMKKTQEIKRLRSIFKKAYVKNDSNLSKFSLKISSNLHSFIDNKNVEVDKSNIVELRNQNLYDTDNNQIDLSYNKIINVIRPKKSNGSQKSSNNITSLTSSPLNNRTLFQKDSNQISITKLVTKSEIIEEKKVLHYNEKLKNERIVRILKK